MIDLDNIRNDWNSQQFNIPGRKSADIRGRRRARAFSGMLLRRYRILAIVSFTQIAMIPVIFRELGIAIWLNVIFISFFFLVGMMAFNILVSLRGINMGVMSVCDAVEAVVRVRRKMARFQLFSIVMAIPMILLLLWELKADTAAILGVAVGAIVGSIVGLRIHRTTKWLIDKLQDSISDQSDYTGR